MLSERQSRVVINSQFYHFNGSKFIKKNPDKWKAYWYTRLIIESLTGKIFMKHENK